MDYDERLFFSGGKMKLTGKFSDHPNLGEKHLEFIGLSTKTRYEHKEYEVVDESNN